MRNKIILIIICLSLASCVSVNSFVKSKSRLHAFSGYGDLASMIKDVVPEFKGCEDKDFNIAFSFVDLSEKFVMYQRLKNANIDYFKDAPKNSMISSELWGVLCKNKLKYITVKIRKSKSDLFKINIQRATGSNTAGTDYIPYLFVAFWENDRINSDTFERLSQTFRKYKKSKGNKAFAVTDIGVWGYSYEEPTTQEAVTLALKTCSSIKNKYPESGPCALVDVNTFEFTED